MAKKTKTQENTESMLLLKASMARAMKAIEAVCGSGNLDAGGYPVNVDVHIEGDINVGNGVEATPAGAPTTQVAFNDRLLLAAMFHALGDDAEAVVGRALTAIKKSLTSEPMVKKLDAAAEACTTRAHTLAFERGVTKQVPTPGRSARAGAVTGKPAVTVAGTVGRHSLEVELA